MANAGNYLLRKAIHVLCGMLILFAALELWAGAKMLIFRWVLIGVLLFALLLDYLRMDWGVRLPLYRQTEKAKEHGTIHGATLYVISTVLCFLLFDFTIAITALAMQYFGDPASAIAGKYLGRRKLFRSKTLQGSLAMLIVSAIAGYAILDSWKLTAIMALTAAFTELILDRMDDNLVVPLTTGAVGTLFSIMWNIP